MSQVSYGTITITDTNDIERIYTVYAKSNTNTDVPTAAASDWKELISEAPGNGNYIWQRTVVEKSGTGDKTYSSPVCLTGEEGEPAKNIIAIEVQYGISANWNTQPSSWSENTPSYDSSKPNYWTRTRLKYEGNTYSSWVVNKDYALTEAIYNSAIANSVAQHANEDAQGAMSQAASAVKEVKRIWFAKATSSSQEAPEVGVTTGSASTYNSWSIVKPAENPSYPYYFYCDQTCTNGGVYSWSEVLLEADPYTVNALNVRTKNFFHGKDSTYDGWFASGRSTSEGLNESDATTYYYNARFAASHVTLGYNKTPVIDLDGTSGAINIYRLPTINSSTGLVTTAGSLGAKLNASALTFYNTSGTATSTFGDSIALASNGASITIGSTDTGKYNTYIDAQGLYLQTGTTSYATLNSNGLVLSKGGVNAGTSNTNNYVYISTEDGPRIAINGYTPPDPTAQATLNAPQWREIIGTKFGVLSDGTLYAKEAHINGAITASSLTIGSNATINDTSGLIRNSAVEVGGRNLAEGSDVKLEAITGSIIGGTLKPSHNDIREGDVITISIDVQADNVVWNTSYSYQRIGCEFSNPKTSGGNQYIGVWAGMTESAGNNVVKTFTGSFHGRVSKTFTMLGPLTTNHDIYIYVQGVSSGTISVGNIKIERGNKATDWTPAPEDVASDIGDASKVANNFLKFEPNKGLMVADQTNGIQMIDATTQRNVLIDADSVDIRNGQNVLGKFGLYTTVDDQGTTSYKNGVQIGKFTDSHIDIDYHSLQLKDKEGNIYFHVSDLRDDEGEYITTFEDYGFDNTGIRVPFLGVSNSDNVLSMSITWDNVGVETTITDDFIDIVSVDEDQNTGETLINITVWDETHTHEIAVADPIKATVTVRITGVYTKAYTAGLSRQGIVSSLSFCEGYNNEASGAYSHAEGSNNCAIGPASHAEGMSTRATWRGSHAEGATTKAYGYSSHAEGNGTTASGYSSHAEGVDTTARGSASHAEGNFTTASGGKGAHAEGSQTKASNYASHAEGYDTEANAENSHAQNLGTVAQGFSQTVIGMYNQKQGSSSSSRTMTDYAFIIGNGDKDTHRSNAFAVDWNGKVWHSGDGQHNIASYVKTSKGTFVSGNIVVYGKVAQLNFTFRNTSSIAGGATLYEGTLSSNSGWLPKQAARGIGYLGPTPFIMTIGAGGGITIQNASQATVIIPSNKSAYCTVTYIMA